MRRLSDYEVEQIIGRLLQLGVTIATVVVVLGAVLVLTRHWSMPVDYGVFHGDQSALRSVGAVLHGAARRDPAAIVQLGLVLLIATPVARVALTLVAFAAQRDRLYVLLTTIVLVLLLYGLVWGRA